eukprot:jgi/Psemu1/282068/fgenesh1_pg.2_\
MDENGVVKRGTGNGATSSMTSKPPYRMEYDKYRQDQLNTGVVSALIGGFSLTNSWELERDGGLIGNVTYVFAIAAVHACTCSALTSAVLYRSLTCSDPEKAVLWMEKHTFLAYLPHGKFALGVFFYLASVVLVAWKELMDQSEAQMTALAIGLISCCTAVGTWIYVAVESPNKIVL